MIQPRNLADTIARAVLDRIETDGCCNSENIGDAVFRELTIAAAMPGQPSGENGLDRLIVAGQSMLEEINVHVRRFAEPTCFNEAYAALDDILREFQR